MNPLSAPAFCAKRLSQVVHAILQFCCRINSLIVEAIKCAKREKRKVLGQRKR